MYVCVLPRMMSWGLLLTPTPALVPAATSTRYCTPVCRPPTTTERMVASTDLLTWNRVSLAKHQIWRKQTCQTHSRCSTFGWVQGLPVPCTPGWCRSAGQWEEGPTRRWWTCCCGSPPSALSPAVAARLVLMGQRFENNAQFTVAQCSNREGRALCSYHITHSLNLNSRSPHTTGIF